MASGYHQPPAALTRMALAPKAPDVIVTPRRDFALLCEIPSLPSIAEIAVDDVKLAGLRYSRPLARDRPLVSA